MTQNPEKASKEESESATPTESLPNPLKRPILFIHGVPVQRGEMMIIGQGHKSEEFDWCDIANAEWTKANCARFEALKVYGLSGGSLYLDALLQNALVQNALVQKHVRMADRTVAGRVPVPRPVIRAKPTNDQALEKRIAELEQELNEARRINEVQHSRLIEERRAASTANRINDQLQQHLDELMRQRDRQFDLINERARANDAALAVVAAKEKGKLFVCEMITGEVIEVSNVVVVRFDSGDDLIEQSYDLDQFKFGNIPTVGDQLTVYVHVAASRPAPEVNQKRSENKGTSDEPPRPRRNVVTGDDRF